MKHIIITGSTRGLGLGLSEAFLDLGCSVTISGRTLKNVEEAINNMGTRYPPEHIFGLACDVRDFDQVQALWDRSKAHHGKVDIWINNAGYSGPQMATWKIPPDIAKAVIETNLLGVIYGSMVAVRGMLDQGYGAIYNTEGLGSDGRMIEGLANYGTSKFGLHYFTKSLVQEVKGSPLVVGSLQPGMLVTDMITKQYDHRPEDWERDKRIFNILADRVEIVAPWMAEQILANTKSGVQIRWLTRRKLLTRFLTSPFHKRELFEET